MEQKPFPSAQFFVGYNRKPDPPPRNFSQVVRRLSLFRSLRYDLIFRFAPGDKITVHSNVTTAQDLRHFSPPLQKLRAS